MKRTLLFFLACLFLASAAFAAEGEPMLSYDDLLSIEGSYEQFLNQLADLLIKRELLSQEERQTWISLQEGDFLSNGGYGSIMTNFYPGVLDYAQEEEQVIELHAIVSAGVINLLTMRRYSPDDSSLSGLILTLNMENDEGAPLEASFALNATDGIFYKWDALSASYINVGTSVRSEGETVLWSCATPVEGAQNPKITISGMTLEDESPLGEAVLTLTISGSSYLIEDDALVSAE